MTESDRIRADLDSRFAEAYNRDEPGLWAAKLQDLCETFWGLLDSDDTTAPLYVEAFADLLLHGENLGLAGLVVPEMRTSSGATPLQNRHKQRIMERTEHTRAARAALIQTRQADFDDPMYQREKDALAEAELYRAKLLLYHGGTLDAEQDEQIQQWLAARPGASHVCADDGDVYDTP